MKYFLLWKSYFIIYFFAAPYFYMTYFENVLDAFENVIGMYENVFV